MSKEARKLIKITEKIFGNLSRDVEKQIAFKIHAINKKDYVMRYDSITAFYGTFRCHATYELSSGLVIKIIQCIIRSLVWRIWKF